MLDLPHYSCLGEALRAALDRWPDEICLIEADREREKLRLTYRQFKEAALALGRALRSQGKPEEARRAFRSALFHLQTTVGLDHPDTRTASHLAELAEL